MPTIPSVVIEAPSLRDALLRQGSGSPAGSQYQTNNLQRLVGHLKTVPTPTVLDIGCLCDQNIEWLVRQGVKVCIDDQFTRWSESARPPTSTRDTKKTTNGLDLLFGDLVYETNSFDAILCWDLFEYLDARQAPLLLTLLESFLKARGQVLAFFNFNRQSASPGPVRYRIRSEIEIEYERLPTISIARRLYQNSEIQELFRSFDIVHSCILKHQMREWLVQKKKPRPR